jgi:hypothetical protein
MNLNFSKKLVFLFLLFIVGCGALRHTIDKTDVYGDRYVGEAIDNKPDGMGTYYWSNGKRYIGGFNNGLANGQGKIIFPNNETFVGTFEDGKKVSGQAFAKDGTPIDHNSDDDSGLNNLLLFGAAVLGGAALIHSLSNDSSSSDTDSDCDTKIDRCLNQLSLSELMGLAPWEKRSYCKKRVCN